MGESLPNWVRDLPPPRRTGRRMGRIRPFVEEDIAEVAALRQKSFRHSSRSSAEELAAYFREMFFSTCWRDEELPSLVYEDATGRPVGFVGVFPRRMLLAEEPIRAAVTTQLMVQAENRGIAALELLRGVFGGVQDLSLTDAASDVGVRIWQQLGGQASLTHSLHWTRPLRPWRHAAAALGTTATQQAVRFLLRPFLNLGDLIATRFTPGSFRQTVPGVSAEELTVDAIVEHWPTMRTGHGLVAEYDALILEYVLQQLVQKRGLGILQRVLVRGTAGTVIGWYLYYMNVGGVGEVVHVAAIPGKHGDVFDHMFYHAWRRGVVALRGRLEPRHAALLGTKHCYLNRDGGWTAIHSKRPEILAAVERGNATISRLDGEFWMTF